MLQRKYNLIIAICNIAKVRNLSKTIINIVENIIYIIDIFLFLRLKKVLWKFGSFGKNAYICNV